MDDDAGPSSFARWARRMIISAKFTGNPGDAALADRLLREHGASAPLGKQLICMIPQEKAHELCFKSLNIGLHGLCFNWNQKTWSGG